MVSSEGNTTATNTYIPSPTTSMMQTPVSTMMQTPSAAPNIVPNMQLNPTAANGVNAAAQNAAAMQHMYNTYAQQGYYGGGTYPTAAGYNAVASATATGRSYYDPNAAHAGQAHNAYSQYEATAAQQQYETAKQQYAQQQLSGQLSGHAAQQQYPTGSTYTAPSIYGTAGGSQQYADWSKQSYQSQYYDNQYYSANSASTTTAGTSLTNADSYNSAYGSSNGGKNYSGANSSYGGKNYSGGKDKRRNSLSGKEGGRKGSKKGGTTDQFKDTSESIDATEGVNMTEGQSVRIDSKETTEYGQVLFSPETGPVASETSSPDLPPVIDITVVQKSELPPVVDVPGYLHAPQDATGENVNREMMKRNLDTTEESKLSFSLNGTRESVTGDRETSSKDGQEGAQEDAQECTAEGTQLEGTQEGTQHQGTQEGTQLEGIQEGTQLEDTPKLWYLNTSVLPALVSPHDHARAQMYSIYTPVDGSISDRHDMKSEDSMPHQFDEGVEQTVSACTASEGVRETVTACTASEGVNETGSVCTPSEGVNETVSGNTAVTDMISKSVLVENAPESVRVRPESVRPSMYDSPESNTEVTPVNEILQEATTQIPPTQPSSVEDTEPSDLKVTECEESNVESSKQTEVYPAEQTYPDDPILEEDEHTPCDEKNTSSCISRDAKSSEIVASPALDGDMPVVMEKDEYLRRKATQILHQAENVSIVDNAVESPFKVTNEEPAAHNPAPPSAEYRPATRSPVDPFTANFLPGQEGRNQGDNPTGNSNDEDFDIPVEATIEKPQKNPLDDVNPPQFSDIMEAIAGPVKTPKTPAKPVVKPSDLSEEEKKAYNTLLWLGHNFKKGPAKIPKKCEKTAVKGGFLKKQETLEEMRSALHWLGEHAHNIYGSQMDSRAQAKSFLWPEAPKEKRKLPEKKTGPFGGLLDRHCSPLIDKMGDLMGSSDKSKNDKKTANDGYCAQQ